MHYVRSLLAKRVDGIVMNSVAQLTRDDQNELSRCGVPVILLSKCIGTPQFSTVIPDNLNGGLIAGRYLLDLGHRVIAHLTGPRRHGNLGDRTKGFLTAINAHGRNATAVLIRGPHTDEGGYLMMKKLLQKRRDVTAIFAASDAIALGAIKAAYEIGLEIPGDVSIVGFDNVELAGLIRPPLTTIDQPKYGTGQAAVDILLARIKNRENSALEHRVLGVRLVERESCRTLKRLPSRPKTVL